MQPQRYGPFKYTPITKRPKLQWPGGARIALWIIPNIETFPLNERVPGGLAPRAPDTQAWGQRDYGCRVGIWRIMEVLEKYGVPGSATLNSEVCDDYPEIIKAWVERGWEFLGHNQSNSRLLTEIPPETERDVVVSCFDKIEKAAGTRPKGWLSSGLQETWNTLDYLVEAGATYICDWCNDDQPYYMNLGAKKLVSLPYSLEINDLPFFRPGRASDDWEKAVKDTFDVLYREGESSGRVMAIPLHPFIIGVPHRIGALDRALDYICSHAGVWKAKGSEIVEHFVKSGVTI